MKGKNRKRCVRIVLAALLLTMTAWMLPGNFTVEKAEAATTLKDPRIVKDSSMKSGQKVTWDCIYFGSYPQREVIADEASYDAIFRGNDSETGYYNKDKDVIEDAALFSKLENAANWDSNGDITLNGNKYRRMKKSDTTYSTSGNINYYNWKDSSSYHYFKYEPIKWRVLDVNGSDAFLLADRALDDQQYNTKSVSMTWEKSTMRSWFNGYSSSENAQAIDYTGSSFINSAFTSSQRNAVKTTDVVNKDNINYGTEGGNDTKDKVFLLSESEVFNTTEAESYGFLKAGDTYDEGRRSRSSTYAKAMGVYSTTSSTYSGNCRWWLRSPGYTNNSAVFVNTYGFVDNRVYYVTFSGYAVRPALHLNISSSDLWSYAGTVCSDGTTGSGGSATVAVDKVTLNKSSLTLEKGTSEKLSATISPSDATNKNVAWTSDNEVVATVSTDGTVKALSKGTANITVKTADGGKTARCKVTVNESAAAPDTKLKNPSIAKDSSMNSGQNVTWDCVYFGSYPQTEVLNENDSEAIDNFEEMNSGEGEDTLEYLKVSDSKWKSIVNASYDSNGDATVGSERYRRIKAEDATYAWILDDDEELDYEDIYYNWLNTTDYHYFKYEPIKWRVLEVNGSDIFLLADKGLDDQRYNTANVGMTWEKSTIRSWLNGYSASNNSYGKSYTGKGFIDTAFLSSAEKNKIKTTDVVNKDNLFKGTEGGENTKDKIYLLSESEVYQTEAAKSYGFMESRGYVTGEVFDEGRKSVSSTYAAAMGACIGPCCWWLRSPGDLTNRAAIVDGGGTALYVGCPVSLGNYSAVRPALHLDISSSNNWKYAGTVCSDGTVKEPGSGGDSGEHQHKYTARITKKATCTTPGVKTYTCIGCSSIYTEEIPATGHDWDSEYTVDKEPTYSKTGKKSIHCLNDGCTAKEDSVIIPMLDPDPDMIRLSLGGDLRDEYYYDGEVDQWYSFTLKKGCKVDISFGGSAGSSSYSEWDISLCSDRLENGYPDGALIGKLESAKRGSNIIVNTTEYLSAGTYYIRVRGDFSSSMGWTLISVDQASLVQIAKIKDQTYTGKAISPKVKVYGCPDFDGNMDPLAKNDDYKVTYSNNKNVGKAKVTVKGIGDYKGTETQTFRILPKSTSLSKLTSTKKGFTAKWKKQSTQTSGYQIMYATNSKFTSGKKTVTVSSSKTTSKKITKLKAKKKYYVRVRTYKKAGSAKYYSGWSKVKTVKTK